jgi:hypothetical protein
MTLIGKLLLLFNFVFSIGGFTWALVLYCNNVDYSDTAPKAPADKPDAPELPAGKLWDVSNQIKALASNKGIEESRLIKARNDLQTQEDRLVADRPWYLAQLEHQRTGATDINPVQSVVFTPKHLPEPDPANFNRPKMEKVAAPKLAGDEAKEDRPLLSVRYYEDKALDNMKALVLTREELVKNLTEDMKLTDRLLGVPPDEKGLRQQVVDERAKWREVADEWRMLQPLETLGGVETALLEGRRGNLSERLRELDEYLFKKHGVPLPK